MSAPFIVGGSDSPPGLLPFVVHIEARVGSYVYSCTGSVVAPTVVLTARHCTYDDDQQMIPAADFAVTARTTRLQPLDPGAEVRDVVEVNRYPADKGDVATLVLDAATTAPAVRLATPTDAPAYGPGTQVVSAGWGRTSPFGQPSNVLQQGTQSVQSNAVCQWSEFDPVTELCAAAAGYRPADCQGDSGGPLLASGDGGWIQVGVISYFIYPFLPQCGRSPDFFARVSSLQGWVQSSIDGTPPPPAFVPPLAPPHGTKTTFVANTAVVTFDPADPDPATLLTGYVVQLARPDGSVVGTQTLGSSTYTASFPVYASGSYQAIVSAVYTNGTSANDVSPIAVFVTAVIARDRTPPALVLSVRKVQRAVRQRGVDAQVRCPAESCTVHAFGMVSVRTKVRFGTRYKGYPKGLISVDRSLARGVRATLRLKLTTSVLAAVRKALRRHAKVEATVWVSATDAAYNYTPTRKRTIRIR